MRRPTLVAAAAALDLVAGDPEDLPHPVRLMGAAVSSGERLLLRPGAPACQQFWAGAGLAVALCCAAYAGTRQILRVSGRRDRRLGVCAEILLGATCLASRNLLDEAGSVLHALDRGDLAQARQRLARIVGRDTAALDPHGISRAAIETLAESSCDGIVAPFVYLALGGVPLAMAFKAISTLDSMIGHHTERYEWFGKAAARLDDAANFVPARLTAGLLLLVGGGSRQALAVLRRDRARHSSPNSGHPEAALAGVLGVRLGGPSTYDGLPHEAPVLNAGGRLPGPADLRRALQLTAALSCLAALLGCAGASLLARGGRR